MESVFYNMYKKYEYLTVAVQSSNKSVSVIKSNLLYLLKQKMEKERVQLPSNLLNGTSCCKWCFNNWTQGKFTARLLPEKKPKACVRSLLKKDQNSLNKFQRKLVKKLKKNCGNKLMFLCHICYKKTSVRLKKPVVEKRKIDEQIKKEKKAKKKKKDVYAGLNSTAMHAIATSKKQPNSIAKIPSLNQEKANKQRIKPSLLLHKPKGKRQNNIGKQMLNQNTGSLLLSLLDPL